MEPAASDPWPAAGAGLAEHARLFAAQPGPRLIAAAAASAGVARLVARRWSARDAIVPAVIIAAQPFTEWVLHVHVLHAKGDSLLAREHRAHHVDPRDLDLVLVPLPALRAGLPLAAALSLGPTVGRRRSALSGLAAGYLLLLAYEWTHFLIHSRYKPRRSFYRRRWRHHRNHHFRNEHHWFGVTTDLGDRVLGTAPAKDAVPLSPTARNLLGPATPDPATA